MLRVSPHGPQTDQPHDSRTYSRLQNGEPISERLFAKHFFRIWNRLRSSENAKDPSSYAKPRVFYILYCLAVSVFLAEGVDAAVFEVFSGGWTDCTNIVQRPLVSCESSDLPRVQLKPRQLITGCRHASRWKHWPGPCQILGQHGGEDRKGEIGRL